MKILGVYVYILWFCAAAINIDFAIYLLDVICQIKYNNGLLALKVHRDTLI